jgi:hypothetical protein
MPEPNDNEIRERLNGNYENTIEVTGIPLSQPLPMRFVPTFFRSTASQSWDRQPVETSREVRDIEVARKTNEQVLEKAMAHRIKLLKLEQCNKCQFHCGDEHLNCAVNPTFLNDLEQEACKHYEEEIIIEDPGKFQEAHLGDPPSPTPLRMMVREDDLSVRSRLQALGYSIEDLCSDNRSESRPADSSSFVKAIEAMSRAISSAFTLPNSILPRIEEVDDMMSARNVNLEITEAFLRAALAWEPAENVGDSCLTEED